MDKERVRLLVNRYCWLRDQQYAVFERYARKHGLTAKELFILEVLTFAKDGCTQTEICECISVSKQTVNAAIKKFWKNGYIDLEDDDIDRRIKIIRFTEAGKQYAERIIAPAARAKYEAMAGLSDEQQAALVLMTELFAEQLRLKYDAL